MVLAQPASAEQPSFAERAYVDLRDRLVTLEIWPGDAINDGALAQALGFGRTPVREALKRLESDRLVVAYPRRGTFATEVDVDDLAHISEVREQLEPVAAAAAAARADHEDRADLAGLVAELAVHSSRTAPATLMRLDMRVHRRIYAATHNPFLEDTLVRYDNLATRIWCLFTDRLPDLAGHIGEHRPLLEAVIAGDAVTASSLSAAHVAHFKAAIQAVL